MKKFLMFKKFSLIFLYAIFLFNANSIFASNIIFNGNENIDRDAILSILGNIDNINTDDEINFLTKKLYDTGYFQDIKVYKDNDEFIFEIKEFNKISEIKLIGNERFKKEDIFQILPLTNIIYINPYIIEEYISGLEDLYKSFGYNKIIINYEIEELENNFANLKLIFNENKISKVNNVFFQGNSIFPDDTLYKQIFLRDKNIFNFFFKKNYKEIEAKNDLKRLRNFYLNSGYKNIQIKFNREFLEDNNSFNIYYFIDEGDKYVVNNINFNLDNLNIDSEKKLILIQYFDKIFIKYFSEDNSYDLSKLDNIKNDISDFVYKNGISFFKIEALTENNNNNNIDLIFRVTNIEPKYVNQINIYGNTRTADKVIRREIIFAEGDPFNDEMISSTLSNLNSLRLFKNVSIDEVLVNNSNHNINITVEENSTGEFNVGLSFGTINGVSFVTGIKEKNFSGLGREVEATISRSDINTNYKLGIVEPYIFNRKLDLIYGISYREDDFKKKSSYELSSSNANIGIRYLISKYFRHTFLVNYDLKDYSISNSATASSNILNLEGNNASISISNQLRFSNLNSFIRPSDGNNITFLNIISPITNDKNGYVKNTLIYKKYLKINKSIFSYNLKLGNITSLQNDEIATDTKYSLGGNTLRGFDTFGVGPRNSRTSYIGGNNLASVQLDFNKQINRSEDNIIDLNLFLDAGSVFGNKSNPTSSSENIRSSYGVGIKFYSLIGPIGFSWAFPIQSESYDIERMFLFSLGQLN